MEQGEEEESCVLYVHSKAKFSAGMKNTLEVAPCRFKGSTDSTDGAKRCVT